MSLTQEQHSLLDQNIIDVFGPIGPDTAEYVRSCINILAVREKHNPDIEVRFTSVGGDVRTGLMIYDMLRLYPGKVTGVVMGMANSIASVILQGCQHRQMQKHSEVHVHNMKLSGVELRDITDPRRRRKLVSRELRLEAQLLQIYVKRSGRRLKTIEALLDNGRAIRSEEALKMGLVDELI